MDHLQILVVDDRLDSADSLAIGQRPSHVIAVISRDYLLSSRCNGPVSKR